jgi:hypothetical protein
MKEAKAEHMEGWVRVATAPVLGQERRGAAMGWLRSKLGQRHLHIHRRLHTHRRFQCRCLLEAQMHDV